MHHLFSTGDRGKPLDSFCAFQTKLNKPSDSDAEHWDMALLLSGLDFYAVEGDKNHYVTMGIQRNYIKNLPWENSNLCFPIFRFLHCHWGLHRHLLLCHRRVWRHEPAGPTLSFYGIRFSLRNVPWNWPQVSQQFESYNRTKNDGIDN